MSDPEVADVKMWEKVWVASERYYKNKCNYYRVQMGWISYLAITIVMLLGGSEFDKIRILLITVAVVALGAEYYG